MKIKAFLTGAVALFTIASALAAPSVTGKWKGRFNVDTSQMPKAQNAQQQTQINQSIEAMKRLQIDLDFAASSSFTITYSHTQDGKNHSANGSWKQQGDLVTLTYNKMDGKVITRKQPMTQGFTLSKDGKSLKFNAPANMKGGSLVFTR